MIKYCFLNNSAYPWKISGSLSFRGYIEYDGRYYSGDSAVELLGEQLEKNSVETLASVLNGLFAFIYDAGDTIYLAADRIRSFPLLWAVVDDTLLAGDDAEKIVSDLSVVLNEARINEYLSSELFVSGNNTLIDGFYQLRAGEICTFCKRTSEFSISGYYHYTHDEDYQDLTEKELVSKFWDAYAKTSRNLIEALHGRTAVVPLSGGADSRMVLRMLKMNNYEKVICYTYGCPGNKESEISRKVAESYGYPWHFVEYSRYMWKKFRNNQLIHDYEQSSFNYCETPHIVDFPAVLFLKENGVLPEDSVFIPGHSGDLIAGSHISEEYLSGNMKYDTFISIMIDKFFPGKTFNKFNRKEIEKYFEFARNYDNHQLASEAEWFNIQERQAKFIVNSVRAYEFFGFEWLIPLWDSTLTEFWSHVPLDYRYKRRLYFLAVEENLASTNDVTSKTILAEHIRKIPGLRTIVRRARRLKSYFKSSLAISNYIPFPQYLTACFNEQPTFEISTLISKKLVRELQDHYS